MAFYYSATEGGFYDDALRDDYVAAGSWPDDAVEISETKYNALLKGQASGKEITPDAKGKPVLTDPTADPVVVAEGTKQQRLREAAEKIAILQDAVDLNMATEDEKFQLIEWKKYRVLLTRIKPESAPDIDWPAAPD